MNNKNIKFAYSRIQNILSEIPFFEEFSFDELDYFSNNLSLRAFPENTVLFQEGDFGDYLFFVVEGTVEVRIARPNSKSLIIATFEEGACIGEMSIVDNYSRSATIIVTKPSELLLLTRNRFESICKDNPIVGIKFLKGIAKNLSIRLRTTTGRFADLS
jgi:CRP-like cAMP-binding protein